MGTLDSIESISTRMHSRDLVAWDKAIANWRGELGSRRIDTSVALNAAVLLITRANDPDQVREHLEKKGYDAQQIESAVAANGWFMKEYFETLQEVLETRKRLDGRIKHRAGE
jgi:hypothetical protein